VTSALDSRHFAAIRRRLDKAELQIGTEALSQVAAYFELLARRNEKTNLSSFDLNNPSDAAIDRIIVEPLLAAKYVAVSDRLAIDVGSGGGSPALPFKIAAPWLRSVLVEAKSKKCGLLRDMVRQLGLIHVEIENCRFEELVHRDALLGAADLVTVRAVKVSQEFFDQAAVVMNPSGRILWFTTSKAHMPGLGLFSVSDEIALSDQRDSVLRILRR
jgi:16S rRNA (guanine(527)-N(7))-methyltransferase RsmG